jgi:hypothetical protein
MDVMMPQAGGVTLFQEIKKDEQLKHIPVIMLTGVSAKAFSHHLKMLNIRMDDSLPPPDAYMEKPLDPAKPMERLNAPPAQVMIRDAPIEPITPQASADRLIMPAGSPLSASYRKTPGQQTALADDSASARCSGLSYRQGSRC